LETTNAAFFVIEPSATELPHYQAFRACHTPGMHQSLHLPARASEQDLVHVHFLGSTRSAELCGWAVVKNRAQRGRNQRHHLDCGEVLYSFDSTLSRVKHRWPSRNFPLGVCCS